MPEQMVLSVAGYLDQFSLSVFCASVSSARQASLLRPRTTPPRSAASQLGPPEAWADRHVESAQFAFATAVSRQEAAMARQELFHARRLCVKSVGICSSLVIEASIPTVFAARW
jgi:hypothetical protein